MNYTRTICAAVVMACGSMAAAGDVMALAPGEIVEGLTGTDNIMTPELRGVTLADEFHQFVIYADGVGVGETPLYEGTLMTRVVRSNDTGMLTFNYMLLESNDQLFGTVSHIDVGGFEGWETRVEYRSGGNSLGDEGPTNASRDESGDVLNFDFGSLLDVGEDSKFFFAMTNAEDYFEASTTASIYLSSGESVSFSVVSANPIPAPGALGLLSAAGLMTVRRRR